MPTQLNADVNYLTDKNDEVFFPVTHQKAVVDDNGTPLTQVLDSAVSDWNQNDSSAKSYIKNRTHYTEIGTASANDFVLDFSNVSITDTGNWVSASGDIIISSSSLGVTCEMSNSFVYSPDSIGYRIFYEATNSDLLYNSKPLGIEIDVDTQYEDGMVLVGYYATPGQHLSFESVGNVNSLSKDNTSYVFASTTSTMSVTITGTSVPIVHKIDAKYIPSVMQTETTHPSNPVVGQFYYNTAEHCICIWNGSSWDEIQALA